MAEPTDPKTQVGQAAEAAKKAAAEERLLAATESQRVEAEKLLKTLKDQNEALAEQDAIQERIARQSEERDQKYQEALRERTRLQRELEGLRMEAAETRDRDAERETRRELNQAIRTQEEMERQQVLANEELDLIKQKREEIEKLNKVTRESIDAEGSLAKDMEEFGDASEETQKKLNSLQGVMGSTFKEPGTGGPLGAYVRMVNGMNKVFSKSINRITAMGGGTFKVGNAFKFLGNSLAQSGGFLLAFLGMITSLGLKIDSLAKGIQKAGGLLETEVQENLVAVAEAGVMAGIGLSETAAAMKALRDGTYSAFEAGEAFNNQLALTVAQLNEVGVGTATSSKALDHFQRTMALSAEEANDLAIGLALAGRETGITTTQMMKDFDAVSSRLAIFGDQNIKIFKEMEAVVKSTGVAIGDLSKMAKTFDKFDTAADAVAKMNAVLGTQLSTIDMMMKNDAERVIAVTEQVRATIGTDFDQLNKFEKMYVAQAMGIEDVAKAQRLLNMDTAEYSRHLTSMQQQQKTQEDLQKLTEELVPVTQKLKLVMDSLFLKAAPLALFMVGFLDAIVDGVTILRPLLLLVAGAMALWAMWSIITATSLATIGIPQIVIVVTALVAGIGALARKFGLLDKALHKKGSPALWELPGKMAGHMNALGQAAGSVAGMMGAAKGALSGLWDIFHKPGSPELYALPKDFAEGFVSIGTSVAKATRQLNEFISLMIKVAQLDFKGFIALRTDSSGTSMVMGSEDVLTSISQGRLTVDVKMPKLEVPKVDVKVFIGNEEFKGYIKTVAAGALVGTI